MAVTVNFDLPYPDRLADPAENVDEAFDAVAAAIVAMDALFLAFQASIAGKAASSHGHAIADITGLQGALDGKMPASTTFSLSDLVDTDGIDDAPEGYVLAKSAGMWVPVSPAAAIGAHGHVIADVTGLSTALSARLEKAQNLADLADKAAARASLSIGYSNNTERLALWAAMAIADGWATQPIGVPIPIMSNIAGVVAPPKDKGYRYILLTAGEDGSGEYNEGVLTSESVSGSAPTITATAVISLSGSPINGQTIRLLNTERRFLRAGSAGTLEDSQNLQHNHTGTADSAGAHVHTGSAVSTTDGITFHYNGITASPGPAPALMANSSFSTGTATLATNGHPHTLSINSGGAHPHNLTIANSGSTEARPRNVGVTYYMRIQ